MLWIVTIIKGSNLNCMYNNMLCVFTAGCCIAAPCSVAIWEWIHFHHLVPSGPNKFRQHREGEALFVLVWLSLPVVFTECMKWLTLCMHEANETVCARARMLCAYFLGCESRRPSSCKYDLTGILLLLLLLLLFIPIFLIKYHDEFIYLTITPALIVYSNWKLEVHILLALLNCGMCVFFFPVSRPAKGLAIQHTLLETV
jgi:hypothetical protein